MSRSRHGTVIGDDSPVIRLRSGCVGAIVLVWVLVPLSVPQASTITPAEYRTRLESAISSLSSAAQSPDRRLQRNALRDSSILLRDIHSVKLPSGESVHPDLTWLDRNVTRSATDLSEALSQTIQTLTLYRDELDQVLAGSYHAESRAAQWVKEIVSRREFHLQIPWIQLFLARIMAALIKFLSEHASSRGLRITYWILVSVGIATVLGILVYLARSVRRSLIGELVEQVPGQDDDFDRYRTSAEWQSVSGDYARRGEFRLAVRAQYHSLLAFLDEKQLIHYDRNRTNWEHLRAAESNLIGGPSIGLHERLSHATRFFERKWYGLETCREQDYASFSTNLAALMQQIAVLPVASSGGGPG